MNKDFLFKNSFKDKNGNIMMFRSSGIKEFGIEIKKEGNLLLLIDSQSCCEGIIEETDGSKEDIKDILLSNGYDNMFEIFEKTADRA